jgi:hypothetical protein
MLHEFVEVANITFKKLILWLVGAKMNVVMECFGHLCGLSSVHSAIDRTHIQNLKPFFLKITIIIKKEAIQL